MSSGSSCISRSIDEAHNLFSTISMCGFQPHDLGETPRKDNECNFLRCSHRFSTFLFAHISLFLAPSIKPRLWKTFSLRMRLWPSGLCTSPFLLTVFSSGYPISPFWPRDCTFITHSLSWPNKQPRINIPMNFLRTSASRPWLNLRMTSRRPWMSWIGD